MFPRGAFQFGGEIGRDKGQPLTAKDTKERGGDAERDGRVIEWLAALARVHEVLGCGLGLSLSTAGIWRVVQEVRERFQVWAGGVGGADTLGT